MMTSQTHRTWNINLKIIPSSWWHHTFLEQVLMICGKLKKIQQIRSWSNEAMPLCFCNSQFLAVFSQGRCNSVSSNQRGKSWYPLGGGSLKIYNPIHLVIFRGWSSGSHPWKKGLHEEEFFKSWKPLALPRVPPAFSDSSNGFSNQSETKSQKILKIISSSWWFQPLWKILVKLGSSSPNRGEHKKYLKPPPSQILSEHVFLTR